MFIICFYIIIIKKLCVIHIQFDYLWLSSRITLSNKLLIKNFITESELFPPIFVVIILGGVGVLFVVNRTWIIVATSFAVFFIIVLWLL